jgi:3'-phosphoadenosine 5'-phosphosulfate sulfotransferase (PAPS reductase)/FAD synthetase
MSVFQKFWVWEYFRFQIRFVQPVIRAVERNIGGQGCSSVVEYLGLWEGRREREIERDRETEREREREREREKEMRSKGLRE